MLVTGEQTTVDVSDLNPLQLQVFDQAYYDARWFGGLSESEAREAALAFVLRGQMVPGVKVD